MRPRLTGLLMAVTVAGALIPAACAHAQAAVVLQQEPASRPGTPFEVMPRVERPHRSYRTAWLTAFAGAGLVAASFPLAREADERYAAYLTETDVTRIDARYDATRRMDRLASGALLTGEGLLAMAVWLRFVHPATPSRRLALEVEPSRCAVSLRF